MIIEKDRKFIFIKTQKTASTSIELQIANSIKGSSIITPQNPIETHDKENNSAGFASHCLASDLQYWMGKENFRNYFSFAVDRDPWEKTISLYYMYKSGGRLNTNSIDEFLDQGIFPINYPIYTDRFDHSKIIVSQLIRYDRLNEELIKIFKEINIPYNGKLQYFAKSQFREMGRITKNTLTKKQYNLIGDVFSHEISLLGWY